MTSLSSSAVRTARAASYGNLFFLRPNAVCCRDGNAPKFHPRLCAVNNLTKRILIWHEFTVDYNVYTALSSSLYRHLMLTALVQNEIRY